METATCFQKKREEGDERKLKEGNIQREKVQNLMNTAVQCKDINLVKTNYPVMIVTEQKRRTIGRLNRIYKQPQHCQTALPGGGTQPHTVTIAIIIGKDGSNKHKNILIQSEIRETNERGKAKCTLKLHTINAFCFCGG